MMTETDHDGFVDVNLGNGIANPAFDGDEATLNTVDGKSRSTENDEKDVAKTRHELEYEKRGRAWTSQTSLGAKSGCGWLSFRPECLQGAQTAKWLLVALCWAGAIQGMVVNGFVNVSVTTIEKRYNLKSANSGLIVGMYDIAAVLCAIPVSYLGSLPNSSKPRWLGWGLVVMGIGSYIFSLPHFAVGKYDLSTTEGGGTTQDVFYCLKEPNVTDSCTEVANTYLSSYKHVFALGQFLMGVGATPLYTIGTAYMDEAVPVKMSSLYLGIFHGMAVVGPAVGYLLGGYFLNLYIDTPNLPPATEDIGKNWLGAWWIGFLISGSMSIILSVFMMAFPKDIPGSEERAAERVEQSAQVPGSGADAFSRIRDLPGAAIVLLKNPSFLFLSLAESAEAFVMSGFAAFVPKVIQSQFSVAAGTSSLIVGALVVPAGGGGTFFGGWLVKRLKLELDGILKLCFSVNIPCLLCALCFLTYCPNAPLAGVSKPYVDEQESQDTYSINSSCNVECNCLKKNYNPVCGLDKVMYYSPCHAGCTEDIVLLNGTQFFNNCSCIEPSFGKNSSSETRTMSEWPDATYASTSVDDCLAPCSLLIFFLLAFFVVILLTFIVSLPGVSATLRAVPDSHRSFALGVQWIFVRLLGTIPGPILFGYAIDDTCIVWQETCDGTGSCSVYDNEHLSRTFLALSLSFKSLSTIFFITSWYFSVRRRRDR